MSGSRAVVIGAGFGGLCAARVLAERFERVILVERDRLPANGAERPGIPQSRHPHALLARGRDELERLFPGFGREMRERGAVETDMGRDALVMRTYGWQPRWPFGIDLLLASRRLVEAVVRERCLSLANVEALDGTTVTGLVVGPERRRACGVRISRAPGVLEADLVVDAAGRPGRAPDWLRETGHEPPAETVVDGRFGYATRWYRAPARLPESWWWRSILIEPKPPENWYGCVLVPIEDGRWIVTLAGLSRRYPPTDEKGFTAALRWLRSPRIAEAVALAEPLTPVFGYRSMANRLRHYERWAQPLEGFVAVADAVCVFNPIYGQGMTTAAICARVLGETIDRMGTAHPGLTPAFFHAQERAQREPWRLATGADLLLADTVGARPWAAGLVGRYMESLALATRDDPAVHQRLFEVVQMLRPLSSLLAPAIAARVVGRSLARRLPGARPADAEALTGTSESGPAAD